MAHIMKINEWRRLPEPKYNTAKYKKGMALSNDINVAYDNGDMKTAGKLWIDLHDLYNNPTPEDMQEFFDIMTSMFTDEVVYNITDYLKASNEITLE